MKKAKPKKIKPIVLKGKVAIPFQWLDPTLGWKNLGRAEFQFCPIFRKGRLVKMFIYRRQQRDKRVAYVLEDLYAEGFRFVKEPGRFILAPWFVGGCTEHRTACFRVYVPDNTEILTADRSSIMIDFAFSAKSVRP